MSGFSLTNQVVPELINRAFQDESSEAKATTKVVNVYVDKQELSLDNQKVKSIKTWAKDLKDVEDETAKRAIQLIMSKHADRSDDN